MIESPQRKGLWNEEEGQNDEEEEKKNP